MRVRAQAAGLEGGVLVGAVGDDGEKVAAGEGKKNTLVSSLG